MPGFDRSGPAGSGPMSGRRLGRCSERGRPLEYGLRNGSGRGFRRDRGGRSVEPVMGQGSSYTAMLEKLDAADMEFITAELSALVGKIASFFKHKEPVKKTETE